MPSPEISVIVPVYNVEKYLRRCIDSILAQTYTDFELMLIDDGSTDASGKICDDYAQKDSRIRVFHKSNGGASSARNVGLDNACGEWIVFADADDFVEPIWLEDMINVAVDNDIVVTGFYRYSPNGNKKECGNNYCGNATDLLTTIIDMGLPGSLWNKLFRNDIINLYQLHFDINLSFREDEDFVFRYLTSCKKCIAIPNPDYHYFEPDWSKYQKSWNPICSFHLVCSIYKSCRTLRSEHQFVKLLKEEIDILLLSAIKRDFIHSKKYIGIYKSSTETTNWICPVLKSLLKRLCIINYYNDY